MRVTDSMVRYTVETLLAAAAVTLTAFAWLTDPVANQRALGAIMGAAFVIFSMMIYAYYTPSITGKSSIWMIAGCAVGSTFLLLAVQLSG